MANFTFTNGTATIGSTEYSLPKAANYSSGSPMTTLGYVQAFIDFSAMAAGDTYQVTYYERANGGTQLIVDTATVTGAQAEMFVSPMFLFGDGWDVTVKKTAGTDRPIKSSVRQDTNDVNALTLSAAAGAVVWSVVSEGAETFGDAIRLIGSRLFGKATVQDGDGAYTFRDKGDTKNRLSMTRAGTARTVSTRDGT